MFGNRFKNFVREKNISSLDFNQQVKLYDNFMFNNVVITTSSSNGGSKKVSENKFSECVITFYVLDNNLYYYIIDYTNNTIYDEHLIGEYSTLSNIYPLHNKGFYFVIDDNKIFVTDITGALIYNETLDSYNTYVDVKFIAINTGTKIILIDNKVRTLEFTTEYIDIINYNDGSSSIGLYIGEYFENNTYNIWYVNLYDNNDKILIKGAISYDTYVIQSAFTPITAILSRVDNIYTSIDVYKGSTLILTTDTSNLNITSWHNIVFQNYEGSFIFISNNDGNYFLHYYNAFNNTMYSRTYEGITNITYDDMFVNIYSSKNNNSNIFSILLYTNDYDQSNDLIYPSVGYIINIFNNDTDIREPYIFSTTEDNKTIGLSNFNLSYDDTIVYLRSNNTDTYFTTLTFTKNSNEGIIKDTTIERSIYNISTHDILSDRIMVTFYDNSDYINLICILTITDLISIITTYSYDYLTRGKILMINDETNSITYYSLGADSDLIQLDTYYNSRRYPSVSITDDNLRPSVLAIYNDVSYETRIITHNGISNPFISISQDYDFSKSDLYLQDTVLISAQDIITFGILNFSDYGTDSIDTGGEGSNMYNVGNIIDSSFEIQIPYTHTQQTNNYISDNIADYAMDGAIENGDIYLGVGSTYFTNMYRGLFYMSVDAPDITAFLIRGSHNQGSGFQKAYKFMVNSTGDVVEENNSYVVFVKNVYNQNGGSINQIIIFTTTSSDSDFEQNIGNNTEDDLHFIGENADVFSTVTSIDYLLISQYNGSLLHRELVNDIVKQFIILTNGQSIANKLSILNSQYNTITDIVSNNLLSGTLFKAFDFNGNLIDSYIYENGLIGNSTSISKRFHITMLDNNSIIYLNDKFKKLDNQVLDKMYNDYAYWTD